VTEYATDEAEDQDPKAVPPSLIDFALSARDFLAGEDEPQEWLIDGLFTHPSAGMLYGWRGIGKTHCAISLAVAVASAGAWLDDGTMRAEKPRVVLYLDGEMARNSLRKRFRKATGKRTPPGLIVVAVEEYVKHGGKKPNLAKEDGRDAIIKLIIAVQERYSVNVEMVVLDNWVSFVRGIDENDNAALGDIVNWMAGLRATGISVLFIHHASKAGQQRGASAREDLLDYVVTLEKPRDWKPYGPAHFILDLEKTREQPSQFVWDGPIEAKLKAGEWQTAPADDAEADKRAQIEAATLAGLANGTRPADAAPGKSGSALTAIMGRLSTRRLVRKSGNGRTAKWELTELGQQELTKYAAEGPKN
jgi:hypothetical protein